jgi:hypothetical protein
MESEQQRRKMKSKVNFEWWANFCDDWFRYKKKAEETGDYTFYLLFLKEVQKAFTELYGQVTKPVLVSLIEKILKLVACQIKESKKSKLPF